MAIFVLKVKSNVLNETQLSSKLRKKLINWQNSQFCRTRYVENPPILDYYNLFILFCSLIEYILEWVRIVANKKTKKITQCNEKGVAAIQSLTSALNFSGLFDLNLKIGRLWFLFNAFDYFIWDIWISIANNNYTFCDFKIQNFSKVLKLTTLSLSQSKN